MIKQKRRLRALIFAILIALFMVQGFQPVVKAGATTPQEVLDAFPDPQFRAYIANKLKINETNLSLNLINNNKSKFIEIKIEAPYSQGLSSLKGIELFNNTIKYLKLYGTSLANLDDIVNASSNLQELWVYNNAVDFNVAKLPEIKAVGKMSYFALYNTNVVLPRNVFSSPPTKELFSSSWYRRQLILAESSFFETDGVHAADDVQANFLGYFKNATLIDLEQNNNPNNPNGITISDFSAFIGLQTLKYSEYDLNEAKTLFPDDAFRAYVAGVLNVDEGNLTHYNLTNNLRRGNGKWGIWFVNIQNNPDIKNIEGIQYLSKYIDRITLHNNMALQNIDALAKANDWPYLHTVSIVYTVDRTNPQNKHKINLDGLSSIKFGPNRDPMYAQQGQVLMVKGVDALITPANYSTLSTTSAFLPNYTASLQLLDVHFMDEAGNVVAPSNLTNYLSHFKDANNVNVGSEINIMHNSSPYQLSNVDFLKNNTNLLSFNGGHNMNLKDISGLADAINLKYLNIRNTCVNTPLSVLNNLTNLETASLFATNINSARGLNAANFPKLKQIYLGSTFVGNEDLPLILASLSISDLLEELSLDETLISDVYAFSNYTNSWPLMKAICLEGNSITDFSPLKTFEDRDITIVKGAQVLLFTNKDLYCGKTDAEDPSKTIKKAIYPLIFNPDNTLGISTLPGYYNQALTYTGNGFEGILRRVTFEDIGVVKPNLQFLLQNNNIVIYNKNIDVSKKVKELLQLQADYFAASNHAQKNEISKNFYTILHSISGFENYSYNSAKPLLQFYYVEKGRETDYRNEKYIANSGYILIDAEIIQKPITTTNTSRVTIVAEKTLDGATPNDNSFNFNLKDTTGKVIQTKGNIGRTITFDALSFDKPGEYIYYLSEQLGQAQNINYDPVNYKATITVSLSDNYSVKIGYEKDGQSYKGVPVFTNTTKKVANFPQTGDASMLALWIIIVSISIIAIVSIIYNQKNSNKI